MRDSGPAIVLALVVTLVGALVLPIAIVAFEQYDLEAAWGQDERLTQYSGITTGRSKQVDQQVVKGIAVMLAIVIVTVAGGLLCYYYVRKAASDKAQPLKIDPPPPLKGEILGPVTGLSCLPSDTKAAGSRETEFN